MLHQVQKYSLESHLRPSRLDEHNWRGIGLRAEEPNVEPPLPVLGDDRSQTIPRSGRPSHGDEDDEELFGKVIENVVGLGFEGKSNKVSPVLNLSILNV